MPSNAQTLIEAVGEYTLGMFSRGTFRHMSATLDADTGQVTFMIDLRRNTRAARHDVINMVLDKVQPAFAQDGLTFTFIFAEASDEMAGLANHPDFAVV